MKNQRLRLGLVATFNFHGLEINPIIEPIGKMRQKAICSGVLVYQNRQDRLLFAELHKEIQ